MPIKNVFSRRRSSGNALDIQPEAPTSTESSFKVLPRHDKATHTFNTRASARPFPSPLDQLRGRSVENLGTNRSAKTNTLDPDWALKRDRGSGGTTNSGSSGFYESSGASARYSSSSTLPSSVDQDREREREREAEDEGLFPRKQAPSLMYQNGDNFAEEPLRPPTTFTSRAARAFSFGQKHNRQHSSKELPTVPQHAANAVPNDSDRANSPQRDRSTTISSYASTAVPTRLEPNLNFGTTNFGDDFSNMFEGIGKNRSREDLPRPPPPAVSGFHRTESEPMFPAKTFSRQILTPSPGPPRNPRDDAGSPYSLDGRRSPDALMSGSALSSPRLDDGPTVPAHGSGIAPAFLGRKKAGYSLVAERQSPPRLERMSSDSYASSDEDNSKINRQENVYSNRMTHLDDVDRGIKRVQLQDGPSLSAMPSSQSLQARAGPPQGGAVSPGSEEGGSLLAAESTNTTPRAAKSAIHGVQESGLYDSSPLGPPSRAIRPSQHDRTASGTPKKMTKAQFEALQRSANSSSADTGADEDSHPDDEYDDEDDLEHAEQLTRQRQKNEANMAIYRQQMKKSTGGGLADLPAAARPSTDRHTNSAPSGSMLHFGGIGGTPPADAARGVVADDDDEDVPLGVLQAHGFPSSARPPTRQGEPEAQRSMSAAGSIMGGGAGQGNLPPFARRLPADPYFGASLVNPPNRESLAFNSAQSSYGGAPSMSGQSQMGHPGGLVGIIAGEERAKAARRGSPNPITGTYNGLPSNMPAQMPQMPRTMSMGSVVAPQAYTPTGYMGQMPMMSPGMMSPGMMMPPQDQTQQQMQQFMQMQMQVMQNMLAMQQQHFGQGTPQQVPQQPADYLSVPLAGQRAMSTLSHMQSFQDPNQASNHGRSMTMQASSPSWNLGQAQQRPNSAMPSAYAPSMSGFNISGAGGPGPDYTPSIAPSERSNIGQPSRYRPVSTMNEGASANGGRTHSLTSSMTLQALNSDSQTKSTIRIVDKPKGAPKASPKPNEDEDEGWGDMEKKRTEKKFGRRKKDTRAQEEAAALESLYRHLE